MNVALWIQQLPSHMSEAFGTARHFMGRHGIRLIALAAFLALTSVATAIGLRDLISATEAGAADPIESAVVAALACTAIVTMWLALEFALEARTWGRWLLSAFVYAVLVLWSIGFGFGFYWKHMASVGQAQDEISAMTTAVDQSLRRAVTSLDLVRTIVGNVATTSAELQAREGDTGRTCENTGSGPGQFALYDARGVITTRIAILDRDVKAWVSEGLSAAPVAPGAPPPTPPAIIGPSATQAAAAGDEGKPLPQAIAELRAEADEVRETYSRGAPDPIAMRDSAIGLSTRAQALLGRAKTILDQRDDFARRLDDAATLSREGGVSGGARCKDSSLADSLSFAAKQLRDLPEVDPSQAALDPQLGARATQAAFYRLWNKVFPFLSSAPPQPFSGRDFVALVAAIVVDIGIFYLTVTGHRGDATGTIARLLRTPLMAPDLRRRLRALIAPDGASLRDLFDRSTIRVGDHFYLVTAGGLSARWTPMQHLQTLLAAAGETIALPLTEPPAWRPWSRRRRQEMLQAFEQHLREAVEPNPDSPPAPAPSPEDIRAVPMRPGLVLALQRLFSEEAEPVGPGSATDEEANAEPAEAPAQANPGSDDESGARP